MNLKDLRGSRDPFVGLIVGRVGAWELSLALTMRLE